LLDSWDRNDLLHEFIDLENNLKPYADTLRPSLLIADLSRQETGASQHKKRRITEEIDSSSQDPPITQGLEELESAEVTGDDDVQRTSPFSTHPSTTAQQSSPGFSSPAVPQIFSGFSFPPNVHPPFFGFSATTTQTSSSADLTVKQSSSSSGTAKKRATSSVGC